MRLSLNISRKGLLKRHQHTSFTATRTRLAPANVLDHTKRPISFLTKEAATAPADAPTSQRWWACPPANFVHLSIGSVYVYSMWTPGMTTALGVVTSAPLDWTHSDVLPVFSTAAVTLGVTTSFLGSWVEASGPRMAGMTGSLFWSSALITTALGVQYHFLPLVYLGYGVLGGVGWGLMYLSPVTTVMKWFPDRRGLATGIALSAFGAGAAIAPTIIHHTMDFFSVAPDFLGSLEDVILETLPDGSQVVAQDSQVGTPGQAVVVATEADTAKHSFVTTGPGVYALGTGNNGTSGAFATLGIGYGIMGALGSRFMSLPHPDWTPDTMQDTSGRKGEEERKATNSENYIGLPVEYVTGSTRQFPLLWLTVFGNATGGLALLSSSKLMLTDIWQGLAPSIVTASFATGYVSSLGVGMALGRFGWSAISDYLGRRNTYMVFGMGIPIVGVAPYFCHVASLTKVEEIAPLLYGFYGGSFLAITFYGGVFSVLPAYIADLFGQKHSGAIHGKALTAWAGSAVAGPMGLAYLRGRSVDHATQDLITKVDDDLVFQHTFGCLPSDREMISRLVDAKTITISRLMEIVPQGTPDPIPFLYDSTCYTAVGLMTPSAFANLFIRPLDVRGILYNLERDTNASTSQSSIAQTNAVKH